jgi:hypothetical protein
MIFGVAITHSGFVVGDLLCLIIDDYCYSQTLMKQAANGT